MYRKKAFKALCIGLSAVFIFSMAFTACGKKDENGTAPTGTVASTTVAKESPTKDFVELTWYMPPPINPQKNETNVMAEVNKQLKEKLNCSLKFNFIDWGSYEEKMKIMSASSEAYDLTMTCGWINKINANVARGAFIPVDDLLAKYGQNVYKATPENLWDAVKYNGKIMAVINPSIWANDIGFAFKKDLVEKYKFDYSKVHDLKDLEPYLDTLKKNEPGITPLGAFPSTTPGLYGDDRVDMITNSIYFDIKSNKLIYWWEDQTMLDKYKVLNGYYKAGYISKAAPTKKDYATEVKSGKYAVAVSGGSVYTEDGSKSTAAYGMPFVDSFFSHGILTTASVTTNCTAISRTSQNPERAMMLMDLLFTDKKFQNLVTCGIEGQDYQVVSGADTDMPTIKSNNPQTWAVWSCWITNLWNSYPDENGNTQKALEDMKKSVDNAKASPILGFNFNGEPVKSELGQCDALNSEMNPILWTGAAPDLDKYIADMKDKYIKAGVEKVFAEIQKQIDEWKAANGK